MSKLLTRLRWKHIVLIVDDAILSTGITSVFYQLLHLKEWCIESAPSGLKEWWYQFEVLLTRIDDIVKYDDKWIKLASEFKGVVLLKTKFIVKVLKMKINSEVVDAIAELKGWHYDLTDARFVYKYEETTKKIGEYVGRVYSKEMKVLIISK